jgi:hypothetical protein
VRDKRSSTCLEKQDTRFESLFVTIKKTMKIGYTRQSMKMSEYLITPSGSTIYHET